MNVRQWIAGSAIVALLSGLLTMSAVSGSRDIRYFLLFAGDTDSTEQVTRWFPTHGASRVILRSWSTHLGFGSNADTTKVDSIAGMRALFSDSICCTVTGPDGQPAPSAADSFVIASQTPDTSIVGIGVSEWPTGKVLRGAANGSGINTYIYPVQPFSLLAGPDHVIGKRWTRIRFTPLRRSTGATVSATVPNRTNGLRGFKMEAYVIHDNGF